MSYVEFNNFKPNLLEQLIKTSSVAERYLNIINSTQPSQDESFSLRVQRHKAWLEAAYNTLHNTEHVEFINKKWSLAAISILKQAWKLCELSSEKLLLAAMGKLGALELNLSSDVDLLLISDSNPSESVQKKVVLFNKLIGEVTEFGFCFRTDFNLRPGGRFGPLITTAKQFQDYYWAQGETWERMAFVRFNPIIGPENIKDEIEQLINKFSFRKFIDLTLFDDLKGLRVNIQSHYFNKINADEQIHLKLGSGGIRDIELFIHALIIINGGKLPEIRSRSTTEICQNLSKFKVIKPDLAEKLSKYYWQLRWLENYVQLINDAQIHSIKLTAFNDLEFDVQSILQDMKETNQIVSDLLGDANESTWNLPNDLENQKQYLIEKGFAASSVNDVWPQLIALTAKSRKKSRDEAARKKFLQLFIDELCHLKVDVDMGLHLLLDFVKSTHVKASFFTLLIREKPLLKTLARIFSTSPYLGGIIASRPELLDSYLLGIEEEYSLDLDEALEQMAESRLITEIISASNFLLNKDIVRLGKNLSDKADTICLSLLALLKQQFHDSSLEIICLGKWGGQELGFKSDLDFIFVTPNAPNENDHKVAKRFVSRLRDQHKGGNIYSVDLRLRPSGNAGPMIVSKDNLKNFLINEAEAWQRQSYLRARSLGSTTDSKEIRTWCTSKKLSKEDLEQLKDIREQLHKTNKQNNLNVKAHPGGLIDIEFAIQTHFLKIEKPPDSANTHLQIMQIHSIKEQSKRLLDIYKNLRVIEQLYQLVAQHTGSDINTSTTSFIRMATSLSLSPEELLQRTEAELTNSLTILKEFDPVYTLS